MRPCQQENEKQPQLQRRHACMNVQQPRQAQEQNTKPTDMAPATPSNDKWSILPPWFALVEWPQSDKSRRGPTTARNMEAERSEELRSTCPQTMSDATALESAPREQRAPPAVGSRGAAMRPCQQENEKQTQLQRRHTCMSRQPATYTHLTLPTNYPT